MNIIFDSKLAQELKQKYTVLELDTVLQPDMKEPLTLYAVVEITNLQEIVTLSFFKEMHEDMIREYKNGNWDRASELAKGLLGQFNNEIDEFYNLVIDFCTESVKLNRTWDGILRNVPKE